MNQHQERKKAVLERIDVFLNKYPLTPEIPRATTLAAELKGALTAMRAQGGDQQRGFGDFRMGSSQRQAFLRETYAELRDISDTATALDPEQFPGVAEKFHLPKLRTYQRVLDVARAFLEAIAPMKTAFVQRGFPADFDEVLQSNITEFETATDRKHEGRQLQRTNTAALALTVEKMRQKVRQKVRELDVIVSKALKVTNPALLASWKNAVRAYSAAQRVAEGEEESSASPAPSPGSTPSQPTPSGANS